MAQGIMACFILATIFGGIALIIFVFFWGDRFANRLGGKKNREQIDEETRIIQEIYNGLTKMENRIDALETILMGYKRKEKTNDF
ncbi:MAG: phage-shock protein [Chitinispirillia bacterium]|jgi:phage shock protein B